MPAARVAKKSPRILRTSSGERAGEETDRRAAKSRSTRALQLQPGERARKPVASVAASPLPRIITDGPPQRIRFSNTEKVLYPKARITKGQVLEYYERISPWLLPYLRNRPVTIERLPEGLAGKHPPHFWQKNTPEYYPAWIPRVELATEGGKLVRYPMVNDVETLLYLINQGTLTFHVCFSTVDDLARPDFVLFDLDPGRAGMGELVTIAKELHRQHEACGVGCTVKTSGKSGLHVIAPWQKGGYEEARAWAMSIARNVAAKLPELATTSRQKDKRGGRVYIDVIQNALGHHAVAPYVLRDTPEATVSTPLDWDELSPRLEPRRFNIKTIFDRLKR